MLIGKRGVGIPTTVYIPDSVKVIEANAFFALVDSMGNGLINVRMSSFIEKIGENAFSDCTFLEEITLEAPLINVVEIADNAFDYCDNLIRCDLYISDTMK